ncbi:MAG: recombinase family protein [Dysgonamonadaceae bacterium]|nr:recombinase family protein [Dysgonamonadaceae bacterium]
MVDDGYSGTNFDRPDFQHMIAEIDSGNVGTLIVKDMSRLGRDYLKVGYYTEIAFPEADVRFIAINNGVDSASQQDSDLHHSSISSTNGTRRIRVRKFEPCLRQKVNQANRSVPILPMVS